eukprot:TRINITY_DN244_c0_g1_i4.p2 TRINITY_DN244_c0_g1~~TRINITY_DN244_c0_g1_i4.p2  ORF type:complete len:54 (+),score=7.12 TRINITY_DN244_c0_g1_i4:972-1133(+)
MRKNAEGKTDKDYNGVGLAFFSNTAFIYTTPINSEIPTGTGNSTNPFVGPAMP